MNEINELRDMRPEPPPAELEAMRMAARERVVAGTRSRRSPRRWRLRALAGGLTAAAAAAAATALVLASGPGAVLGQHATAGRTGTVVTAAWTVREEADGTVTIYLRQYANPAGLQQTLRADGVGAIVRQVPYALHANRKAYPTCMYDPTDKAPLGVWHAVVTIVRQNVPAVFIIHPDAMPPGSALFLPFMANVPLSTGTSNLAGKPLVLTNDTVPACVPIAFAPAATPTFAPKAG